MASILALVAVISAAAYGSASAATITGTIKFGADTTNYYDPANNSVFGGVPAGYGNSGGQPVAVGAGVEFGYQDSATLDTADFTFNSLVITSVIAADAGGAASWTQTFTTDTPGFFNGLILTNDTFLDGVIWGVVGNKLTVSWGGTDFPGTTGTATFSFDGVAPVPLPAALPLFATILVGGGLVAWRRRRKAAAALRV